MIVLILNTSGGSENDVEREHRVLRIVPLHFGLVLCRLVSCRCLYFCIKKKREVLRKQQHWVSWGLDTYTTSSFQSLESLWMVRFNSGLFDNFVLYCMARRESLLLQSCFLLWSVACKSIVVLRILEFSFQCVTSNCGDSSR